LAQPEAQCVTPYPSPLPVKRGEGGTREAGG
jgi:hypothetical protein